MSKDNVAHAAFQGCQDGLIWNPSYDEIDTNNSVRTPRGRSRVGKVLKVFFNSSADHLPDLRELTPQGWDATSQPSHLVTCPRRGLMLAAAC